MPRPKLLNPRVKINYRLPRELLDQLKEHAKTKGITDTEIIESGIRLYLEKESK